MRATSMPSPQSELDPFFVGLPQLELRDRRCFYVTQPSAKLVEENVTPTLPTTCFMRNLTPSGKKNQHESSITTEIWPTGI
jgi:hypothetical protein